jgi:23S rRNA (uracil1939-C5)-methyltransferase
VATVNETVGLAGQAIPTVGDVVELVVENMAYGADAVARLNGLAVFVTDAVPGDRVLASITEIHARFARARVDSILDASPDRREYPCPKAPTCGGCQWQHIVYERQLSAKEGAVRDTLQRIGGWSEPNVLPIVPSPREWNYRNKARYAVEKHRGTVRTGYRERHSHRLVALDTCPLNMPGVDRALHAAADILGFDRRYSDIADGLESIVARESRDTGEIVVRLMMKRKIDALPFVEALTGEVEGLIGITSAACRPGRAQHVTAKRDRVLWGSPLLTERVGEWTYSVSASSFFQVNPYVAPALVDLVRDAADIQSGDAVIDAYGGVGLFSVALAESTALSASTALMECAAIAESTALTGQATPARRAGSISLIESDSGATRDARHILRSLDTESVSVHTGDVGTVTPSIGHADVIVCDPPRQGAGRDTLVALDRLGASRFVYIACDPASLARDSATLRDLGWQLVWARPVDLFPQTYHIETVALFHREG